MPSTHVVFEGIEKVKRYSRARGDKACTFYGKSKIIMRNN